MKLGEAIYASSQDEAAAAAAADDGADAGPSDEDIVDADFEEVDDEDEKKSA
jgi:molecular chaperone DnaK